MSVGRERPGQLIQTVPRLLFSKLCLYPRMKKHNWRNSKLIFHVNQGDYKADITVPLGTVGPNL